VCAGKGDCGIAVDPTWDIGSIPICWEWSINANLFVHCLCVVVPQLGDMCWYLHTNHRALRLRPNADDSTKTDLVILSQSRIGGMLPLPMVNLLTGKGEWHTCRRRKLAGRCVTMSFNFLCSFDTFVCKSPLLRVWFAC
jgi:hypothetical protein